MIDIHAHFEGDDFPDEWAKIRRAGVDVVILAGDNLENSKRQGELARRTEGCYFTVGIHPENAGKPWSEAEFLSLAAAEKCVAVGEIGLDYHYPGYDKSAQRELFERQIALAEQLAYPIQIHSRDACRDTLSILKEHALPFGFVMHCYAYGAENLDEFLRLGGYVSFGGPVCFHNAKKTVESAKSCPIDRMLTETDSPYLSPFRGERNSPANLPVIASRLAALKEVSTEEFCAQIGENAKRLFPKLA